MPFDDDRDSENDSSLIGLGFIPLVPFGWCHFARPEGSQSFATIGSFDCDINEDLSKALAVSLRRSNLFKDAYFSFGGEQEKANLIITAHINKFYYRGKFITYGLSSFGCIFWLFGAPNATSFNEVNLNLYMKNKDTIVWEYTISGDGGYWQSLYYNYGYDVKDFSKILQNGYNEAIYDLQKKMRDNPEAFK
ncbi:MAG: hypothetical protein WCR55_13095 [Lentisphaerota bacterium]